MDYYNVKEKIRNRFSNHETMLYKIVYKIHRILLHCVYGEYGIFRIRFLINRRIRMLCKVKSIFDEILELKNKYAQKRCFIVATGPSLSTEDLEILYKNNEITFGMNSVVRYFDKTEWRPQYYVLQDCDVYKKNAKLIKKYDDGKSIFLIADIVRRYAPECEKMNSKMFFAQDLHNHNCKTEIDYSKPSRPKYSNDCFLQVEDGFTVTYSAIQLATYMGFKEIYLLGVDCDYSNNISRIKGHVCSPEDQMKMSYMVAAEYAKNNKIKIYNATRGGKLEVFDRVEFDDLF